MSTTVASLLRGHKGFGKLDDEKDLLVPYLPHWEKKNPWRFFFEETKKNSSSHTNFRHKNSPNQIPAGFLEGIKKHPQNLHHPKIP